MNNKFVGDTNNQNYQQNYRNNKKAYNENNDQKNNAPKSDNENQIQCDDQPMKMVDNFLDNIADGSLNQDIRLTYKFKEVLGGGHFGTVRKAYIKNEETRKFFAVKSIKKSELNQEDIKSLIKEVDILSNLDHPNIIKFYETYNDNQYFHIVMELCNGKEVFDRILEEGTLTEQKVAKIIYKVLGAISYCHSVGVTHRDIKPENILFENKNSDAEIKLIDFGLSSKTSNEDQRMHTILGTPYYVAPEVLRGNYDKKCDVWNIGAITYIMLCGDPPFTGNTNNVIFSKIMNEDVNFDSEKFKMISKDAITFIKRCMIKNPDERMSALDALNHEWFIKIHQDIHKPENFGKEILDNLKSFNNPKSFQKMILKYLLTFTDSGEIKRLKEAFMAIDFNNEGFICVNDLERAFKNANIEISTQELQNITKNADLKQKFVYSEFLIAASNQNLLKDKSKLKLAFKHFDVDNSGFIDISDLKNTLLRSGRKNITNEDIKKIVPEVIHNKGKLNLEDFLALFE